MKKVGNNTKVEIKTKEKTERNIEHRIAKRINTQNYEAGKNIPKHKEKLGNQKGKARSRRK